MTIIEFFDNDSIENIVGALLCKPSKVILIGDKRKQMERARLNYLDVLERHGITTEISVKAVTRNNLQYIVETLENIIIENGECIFDLTGGEELYLVAVGIVMSRFSGEVKCHRFNLKNDTLIDCDADGVLLNVDSFDISLEDNIRLYGGELVTDPEREIYTYPWNYTADFESDIDAMWDICRADVRLWNAQIGALGAVCDLLSIDGLDVSYDKAIASEVLKRNGEKLVYIPRIMSSLSRKGLINSLSVTDEISFSFKNEQVKRCLTVAGAVLEHAVAKRMRGIKDDNGQPLYHDVIVGAVLDWSGEEGVFRTVNEIDVLAMKSAIPVFVSCKNGAFDANETYKLTSVAERFGGADAKKVIVTTAIDKLYGKADHLRARMQEMGIRGVENVDEVSDAEFERVLRSLWSN